jgi:cytochrome c oxidase cbb3-type subunit 3
MRLRPGLAVLSLLSLVLATGGCKREERGFRVEPPLASRIEAKSLSPLSPGPGSTLSPPAKNDYEQNAYAMSEGKRLYSWFNCVGCHAHGGGGMGPPLMDPKWVYGSQPEQVFSSIVEGRPNGMPSFRGRIPDFQVWQIAAYVRSMSGLANKGAAPGRNDDMQGKPPENSAEKQEPKDSGIPKSAEMPR